MTLTRLLVLALGPPLLVGAAYDLSFPIAGRGPADRPPRETRADPRESSLVTHGREALAAACQAAAEELQRDLPREFREIIRPPFILAGDLSEDDLQRLDHEVVQPVTNALWRSYFDRRPDRPVTIVALENEAAYYRVASRLDGYEPRAYAGYTQRGRRRIVVNLATGNGTLVHELAHVLASFDFPEMPEWFDEGLAALHEDAAFSADGLTLIGRANWRTRFLCEALRQTELPSLEMVITSRSFRGEEEGMNYALVRTFCHYLQERGLLSHFYRKFRSVIHDDPNGLRILCELLGADSLEDIDRDFRAWVVQQNNAPQ